jgi:hypothetical protein
LGCPLGKWGYQFAASSDAMCVSCKSGKTTVITGANSTSECVDCGVGKISVGDGGACELCTVGRFQALSGQFVCELCGPGEMQDSSGTACENCPAGKASLGGGDNCVLCSGEGQYTDVEKLAVCKLASAGHRPAANRASQEQCPRNHFSYGSVDECEVCPAGGHSNEGAVACGEWNGWPPTDPPLASQSNQIKSSTNLASILFILTPPISEYCISGEYYKPDTNTCEDCPAGTISVAGVASIDDCEPCSGEGEYSNAGSALCSWAGSGTYPNPDRTGTLPW